MRKEDHGAEKPSGRKATLLLFPKGAAHVIDGFSACRDATLRLGRDFFSAELFRTDSGEVAIERASRAAGSIRELVALLAPDGVVSWGNGIAPDALRAVLGPRMPVVFVDQSRDVPAAASGTTGMVGIDQDSIAAAAARELLAPGRCRVFAFVPFPGGTVWSRSRGEAFARAVDLAGGDFRAFDWPPGRERTSGADDDLGRWIAALPKPCGILAANDAVGEQVLAACARSGLTVPDDVSVIGVDDFAHICEFTSPTLSSIALDFRAEGAAAAELVAALPCRGGGAAPRVATVPVSGIVRRASTRFVRDRRVARALETIRLHACEPGFSPRRAISSMGVSRALAYLLFRKTAGHTMLDEIHAVRLARAKALLASGKAPDAAAAASGYASYDDFRRVFRKRVGTTVRKWRLGG